VVVADTLVTQAVAEHQDKVMLAVAVAALLAEEAEELLQLELMHLVLLAVTVVTD
jgi:hypothetical protein